MFKIPLICKSLLISVSLSLLLSLAHSLSEGQKVTCGTLIDILGRGCVCFRKVLGHTYVANGLTTLVI